MRPFQSPRRTLFQTYFFLAFLRGTFPPARRASESPMAIACFRLVTFFPDRPLFNVPRLRSRIARSTFSLAIRPYFAIETSTRARVQSPCLQKLNIQEAKALGIDVATSS